MKIEYLLMVHGPHASYPVKICETRAQIRLHVAVRAALGMQMTPRERAIFKPEDAVDYGFTLIEFNDGIPTSVEKV